MDCRGLRSPRQDYCTADAWTLAIERAALLLRRDLTLGTLMDRLEKVHGDRQLVVESDDGLSLTYTQAAKRVRRWAGGIAARTSPGDVVVIATKNGYEQMLLCFAASFAGAQPRDEVPLADVLEILELDRELLAVDARGGGETSIRLRLGERVRWKRAS